MARNDLEVPHLDKVNQPFPLPYVAKLATTAILVNEVIGFTYDLRFPAPTTITDEVQATAWVTRISSQPLPRLEVVDEASFEDWADQLGQTLRERSPYVDEERLITIIIENLPPKARKVAASLSIEDKKEVEAFLSAIATMLFKQSNYIYDLYFQVYDYTTSDLPRVTEVIDERLTRYVRLATRWQFRGVIYSELLDRRIKVLLASELRLALRASIASTLLIKYELIEEHHAEKQTRAFVGAVEMMEEGDNGDLARSGQTQWESTPSRQQEQAPKRVPSSACWQCGGMHWRNDCPHRDHICRECGRKGHLESCCNVTRISTGLGFPSHELVQKPAGGALLKIKPVDTEAKRLDVLKGFADDKLDRIGKRREKAKKSRDGKKVHFADIDEKLLETITAKILKSLLRVKNTAETESEVESQEDFQ